MTFISTMFVQPFYNMGGKKYAAHCTNKFSVVVWVEGWQIFVESTEMKFYGWFWKGEFFV